MGDICILLAAQLLYNLLAPGCRGGLTQKGAGVSLCLVYGLQTFCPNHSPHRLRLLSYYLPCWAYKGLMAIILLEWTSQMTLFVSLLNSSLLLCALKALGPTIVIKEHVFGLK